MPELYPRCARAGLRVCARMDAILEDVQLAPLVLHLRPAIEMSEDQFFEFCQINQELQIERTAEGDIVVMPPEGGGSGYRSSELFGELRSWARRDRTGVAFGSSTGFTLPNTAVRSPDAAWVRKDRLRPLTKQQREKFLPLCPDFAVEVRSPTDRVSRLKAKMEEYVANGAMLAWLLDPVTREVYVYRPGHQVERLRNPKSLSADPELPGFVLDLGPIWELDF